MTSPLNQIPHKSNLFKMISSENKIENRGSTLKYKFKWKDHEYTITWENPGGIISDKDKNQYIHQQIDKMLLLIERHLYVNNKTLKCSLDLQQVNVIKKRPNGSESDKKIPSPFDFDNEVKALNDKKNNEASMEKAKRKALEDKLKHAEEAAKMQKSISNIPIATPPQITGLDKLGHIKIENTDEHKEKVSYGPFGYMVKLIVDLFTFVTDKITKLTVFKTLKDKITSLISPSTRS